MNSVGSLHRPSHVSNETIFMYLVADTREVMEGASFGKDIGD